MRLALDLYLISYVINIIICHFVFLYETDKEDIDESDFKSIIFIFLIPLTSYIFTVYCIIISLNILFTNSDIQTNIANFLIKDRHLHIKEKVINIYTAIKKKLKKKKVKLNLRQ